MKKLRLILGLLALVPVYLFLVPPSLIIYATLQFFEWGARKADAVDESYSNFCGKIVDHIEWFAYRKDVTLAQRREAARLARVKELYHYDDNAQH